MATSPWLDPQAGVGDIRSLLSSIFGPSFDKANDQGAKTGANAAKQTSSQAGSSRASGPSSGSKIDYSNYLSKAHEKIYGLGEPDEESMKSSLGKEREKARKDILAQSEKTNYEDALAQSSAGYPETYIPAEDSFNLNPEAESQDSLWSGYSQGPSQIDPFSMSYIGNEYNNPIYYDENFEETFAPERQSLPKGQGDEFRDYLKTEEGQKWLETYGYNNYEDLRMSLDMDAYLALLGMRDGFGGIPIWKTRYSNSGVDFSDPELAEKNFEDWMYDHIVDVGDYERGNKDITLANNWRDTGNMARALYDKYNWSFSPEIAEAYGLDADDVALIATVMQAEKEGLNDANAGLLKEAWDTANPSGAWLTYQPYRSKDYSGKSDQLSNVTPLVLTSDLDSMVLPQGKFTSPSQARGAYDQSMAKAIMNLSNNSSKKTFFKK